MRNAKERGYRIALDDAVSLQDRAELLPYVDIIKLELPALTDDEIRELTRVHKNSGRKVLAEKVETQEQFKTTKDAGCDYFQGYFFCVPQVVEGKDLSTEQQSYLRLLQEVSRPDVDFDRLEELIKSDVSLSYKLLRYLNSASIGMRHKITSIKQAFSVLRYSGSASS